MIESLTIGNFLSFREKATISFKVNSKRYNKYQVVEIAEGVKLLKLGIIYGANASGKSNFIKAFQFLKIFWKASKKSKDNEINIIPFVLTQEKPSFFELVFYVKHKKYVYTLELNSKYVLHETLIAFNSQRPALIFKRELRNNTSEIEYGYGLNINSVTKETIRANCLPNMSLFSAYNKVNTHIEEIDNVLHWINKHFRDNIDPDLNLRDYVNNLIHDDFEIKNQLLLNLQEADFNISNITVEKREELIPDNILKAFELLDADSNIDEENRIKNKVEISESIFEHIAKIDNKDTKKFSLSYERQSRGTMRMFGLSGALLTTIKQNAFLAVDEIEARLHPLLIKYVIKKFLYESDKSQLLVTTHYDSLLDCKELISKDNIFFAIKEENASSKMVSFGALPGVNRITSWQKAYREGLFKAIPNIPYITHNS
jgi:AAA15 family ATPase/GTPase